MNDRLGLDATVYHKQTEEPDRPESAESYGTGFILFNLNGASTENHGSEIIGPRHAGASARTSRGISSRTSRGARQDRLAAERAAGVVRLRHVAVRQRPQRHAAGPVDDVADRLVLPSQQRGPDPHRSDDRPPASVSRRSSTTATIVSRISRSASRTTSGSSARR